VKGPVPEGFTPDNAEPTEEDERELAETLITSERAQKEHREDPMFDPEYWLDKASADAAQQLHELFEAGYDEQEVRRVAKIIAADIKKEHPLDMPEQELADTLWERSKRRRVGGELAEAEKKEDERDEPTQVDLPKK